jgi:hypothetical protein
MLTVVVAVAAASMPIRPEFQPLAFLSGHCWRGTFQTGEEDVHCFEPVYDGAHLRDRHEVKGPTGLYRGETLYSWNGRAVEFTYWNGSGGVSRGTVRPDAGRLVFGDQVYRGTDGREQRISSYWRRLDDRTYEAVTTSAADPTASRVVRYQRVDSPPVRVEKSRAPDGSHVLMHETVVAASPGQVWAAIATAQGWSGWAVPIAWSPPGDPDIIETSYDPTAKLGGPANIQQRILARAPGRLLAFRTVKAPASFKDFASFSRVTSLFELEPVADGKTRVRLTGTGYSDDETGRRLLGFFEAGNGKSLEWLRERFAIGPANWPERLAAMAAAKSN